MVDRAQLLAALAEIKALKDDVSAKAKDLAWQQQQQAKLQEQLQNARVEAAQLRADMSAMVPRTDLDAANALIQEIEAAAKAESRRQREAIASLHEKMSGLEEEKSTLVSNMQVRNSDIFCTLLYSYKAFYAENVSSI
jgi:predicted  nucleic acid-binding Zn-ribbon protein